MLPVSSLWVLGCSAILFRPSLSIATLLQFWTFISLRSSITSPSYLFLCLPNLLLAVGLHSVILLTSLFYNFIYIKRWRFKVTLEETTKAHKGSSDIALLFFNLGAIWGWLVNATPQPLYLRGRPGTRCTGSWEGPRAGLNWCGKSLPHRGIDPRTVQPVASRYTDWTIPAPGLYVCVHIYRVTDRSCCLPQY